MQHSSRTDPLFVAVEAESITRADVAGLIAGRLAAVRVPGLLSAARCQAITAALAHAPMDRYDESRVFPVVAKFGPAINDHRSAGELREDYWDAASAAEKSWSTLGVSDSPRDLCLAAFRGAWPDVAPARRQGREMHVGIVREINAGLQVHFDDAVREYAGRLLDSEVVAQLAFNIYIRVPPAGGETVLWRRRWQPDDESLRIPGGYGFQETVAAAAQSLTLRPTLGEGFLFDPRLYHTVRQASDGRRISIGCFVGLTDDGRLALWS
ncbi:proline hydroxylase [Micromonospora sp. NPDC047644]|uniref:2OG-Fe(II)-dependent halogenase WelO5 family protein n=1 Tax=Micromonospora sp. NPDC047644 TaxID=3157203 RepID=UPI003451F93F